MATSPASPVRVLLVEDSPMVRSHLVALLNGISGLELIGVEETATSAIDAAARSAPDLVILDIALKAGNGFDVLRAIKRGGFTRAVIVFTNHDTALFRRHCIAAGADWFLSKSQERDELERLLRVIAANGIDAAE